jgi:hypothetical protein
MVSEIQVDQALVRKVLDLKSQLKEAEDQLSNDILSRIPFKKNDVVRDKDTGARYRIDGGYGYMSGGRAHCSLRAYRVYSTGRREASASSQISLYNLEKVP